MKNYQLFLSALLISLNSYALQITQSELKHHLEIDSVYFTDGSFQGQKVDQSIKTPVKLISELETDDAYYVSHFFNQGKFWIAEVPKENIQDVVFQIALFKGPLGLTLAHAQYRFIGTRPLKLYRLDRHGKIRTTSTSDFVFTIQAALPEGQKYNAQDAILGNYKIVARLVNSYDRVQLEEIQDGDVVTQYLLTGLTQNEKDAILKNAVLYSDKNLLKKNYVATTENCISIAFDILDKSLGIKKDRVELTIENFFMNGKSPNEKMILDALTARQLIGPLSKLENYDRSRK